jgi:hypothetical protein
LRLRGTTRNLFDTSRNDTSGQDEGILKAYDYQNGAHRMQVVALEADEGPYRLRDDAAWPPKARAYGGEAETVALRYARPIRITTRLLLPVTLLVTLLGAAYLYSDDFLILSGASSMLQHALLATSDLILPLAWYALHLTNRRYGGPYAFGQLLAALGIAGFIALVNPGDVDNWINLTPALSWRAILAFGFSFLLANFVAITFFDAARGPRWWVPPLWASFAASLVFSAVYYPAAFAGEIAWTDMALVHFALFFGESVLLLVPYCLLRPAMRPLNGMNGY